MTNPCSSQQFLCLCYLPAWICLSLLTPSIFGNFPSPWLHWFLNRKNSFGLTQRSNPSPCYFWEEHETTWLCKQKEKDTINYAPLLVSSFSFKSLILIVCFMHTSCCMSSNIPAVLSQTLPMFTITDLRWERPEIYTTIHGVGMIYAFWPFLWVVPHALLALITMVLHRTFQST